MNLATLIIYFVWFLSATILNRLMRSKTKDKKGSDKNSLAFIWLTIFICIPLAIYISMNYPLNISTNSPLNIGLAIILTGLVLRLIIVKSLGVFFTVDVTIKKIILKKKMASINT